MADRHRGHSQGGRSELTAYDRCTLASGTRRSGSHPGLSQGAGLILCSWSRLSAIARGPCPADQWVATNVMHEVIQAPAAVAFGILDLRADLAERLAFPTHLARREVPSGLARHAGRFEIGLQVADRAPHRRKTKTVCAAVDRRLVQAAEIALTRVIAGGVAVHAARMRQHLAHFRLDIDGAVFAGSGKVLIAGPRRDECVG